MTDTTETLTESDFRLKADHALEQADRALMALAETLQHEAEFEVELQNGVLQIVFEEPVATKFVVSPNGPVRQIWVSAMARSYKLPWSADQGTFALEGETLSALLERLTRQFLES